MDRHVALEEVVQSGNDSLRASLYLSCPAGVLAYHPGGSGKPSTADVQPLVMDVRTDLDTGAPVFEAWSPIYQVPVAWPCFCGGAFAIQGVLQPADMVTLEAFDMDPTTAFAQGRSIKAIAPNDFRRLGGNYYRAVPTDLLGPSGPAPSAPGLVIGQTAGTGQIVFGAGVLQAGGPTAVNFVAIAALVQAEFAKIAATLAVGAATVASVPGPVVFASPYLAPAAASLASTVLKSL